MYIKTNASQIIKATSLSLFQADWCSRLPDRAEMRRNVGRCCGERLTHIGWLLITTVLLSMLKHTSSRWAGSLWLSEREGGCCGCESGGEGATETPPRQGVRTNPRENASFLGSESSLRSHMEKLIRALLCQRNDLLMRCQSMIQSMSSFQCWSRWHLERMLMVCACSGSQSQALKGRCNVDDGWRWRNNSRICFSRGNTGKMLILPWGWPVFPWCGD